MKIVRSKIHIIAGCTSRKRIPPTKELGLISPRVNLEKRAADWWKNLNTYSSEDSDNDAKFQKNYGKIKASDLYIGSYWSSIRQLSSKASVSNFVTDLWIISAGYGLISSSDDIYSYSATFTPGDKNSVMNGAGDVKKRAETLRKWWGLISDFQLPQNSNPRKLSQLFRENSEDYFLIVASANYLTAVETDLLEGVKSLSSPENLVIITSKSFSNENLQKNIVAADARLQCSGDCAENCQKHLVPRGIRGAISAALAIKVIERVKENGFNAPNIKEFIQDGIEKSPPLINPERTRVDDAQIRKFISQELDKFPSASCTSLLLKLRSDGLACEQKRFREIYQPIKRSAL